MLICVPLTSALLRTLHDQGLRDVAAHAPTGSLMAAHGYDASMDEDADFAALTYASVASLRSGSRRLVAVAQVPHVRDAGTEFGEVVVAELGWSQVTGLFIDEPAVAELVAAAGPEARAAVDLATACDGPAVTALLEGADLLWYGPEEIDDVLAQDV